MLKLFRDSNHAAPPFAPTPAEKQFGGLMDTELAQRIVTAKHFPIVDSVAKKLLENVKSDAPGQDAKKEMEKANREAQTSRLMTNSDSIAKSSMAIPLGVPKAQAPSIPTTPAAPQP
jgi:Rod binding domain-containing protein